MYDKYDYIIKSVTSKRGEGYVNKYHAMITGAKCTPGLMEVGYKGYLLIDVFNTEAVTSHNWYYTSPVESIENNEAGDLVIETLYSTYVLSKI